MTNEPAGGILSRVKLHLIESFDDVSRFRDWMEEPREVLGVDTETEGLSPERDKVRLIQLGDRNEGWAIPWERWSGLAIDTLDRWRGPMVFHNSLFDIRMIQRWTGRKVVDWPWDRTYDTMGMAHVLDSTRPKGLKPLAAIHVDRLAIEAQKSLDKGMIDNKWTWATVPIDYPPYWIYGAMDPVLTVYMFEKFWPQVQALSPDSYELEMGATRVSAKMEEYGFMIDQQYCADKSVALNDYAFRSREWIRENFDMPNPTAMQLIKYFNANGVPLLPLLTKGGAQKMDKEVMDAIDHPLAKTVQNIKKAEKKANDYLGKFITLADSNSRLHPNINPMGARTSRMSISDPPLQQLPSNEDTVRNAFVPSPGHSLLTIDADQIEARLMAHFSVDRGLIAAFMSDQDFFCVMATALFGYNVTKDMKERKLVKTKIYGQIYGQGVEGQASKAGVPLEQMQAVNEKFNQQFPGVTAMTKNVGDIARSRARTEGFGYVITPYGRRLRADRGKEYALVNYLLQGHAAEILKKKIVALDAALPDEVKMMLPVHDEIVFEVPTGNAEEALREAEMVLNQSEEYNVPITWSGDILHKRWGEKYDPAVME